MNNSDIIAALSIFLAGAIFLAQTNGDLIKLKFRKWEIIAGVSVLVCLIILANSTVYERWGIKPYFAAGVFYLTPSEWALVLFLVLFGLIINRVFTDRIYRQDFQLIFILLHKYKAANEYAKCWNLIEQAIGLSKSAAYFQQLDLEFFSDPVFIYKTTAERPHLLTTYCSVNIYSSLNIGQNLHYVLSGLFSSPSNPVFSEMDAYGHDELKGNVLNDLISLKYDKLAHYEPGKKLLLAFPIIGWFVGVLRGMPSSLKEDILHFLNAAGKENDLFNSKTYSGEEIDIVLKRDTVFNVLRFLRISLVEHVYTYQKGDQMIDRVLLVFYSAWEYVQSKTELKTEGVALNNSCYTINEYLLKYQFESYVILLMVQTKVAERKGADSFNEWTIKQLFAKLDGLTGSEKHINSYSKRYYIEEMFDLYFETEKYCGSAILDEVIKKLVAIYIRSSLERSPYGKHELIEEAYNDAFNRYDFVPFQDNEAMVQQFYNDLLPFTQEHEYNITGSVT